jgi:hypothetical protein
MHGFRKQKSGVLARVWAEDNMKKEPMGEKQGECVCVCVGGGGPPCTDHHALYYVTPLVGRR